MKPKESLSDARLSERLGVSAEEEVKGAPLGDDSTLYKLVDPPAIALQPLIVLGIYCLHLALRGVLLQQRGDEELGEAVEGPFKAFVGAVEVVVGVCCRGVGVVHAAIVADVLTVLVLRRVLFSPHEKHVLQEVSCPVEGSGIQGAPNAHVQGGRRLVGLGVADEEGLQLVGEDDVSVLAAIA